MSARRAPVAPDLLPRSRCTCSTLPVHRSLFVVPAAGLLLVAGCSGEPAPAPQQAASVCFSPENDIPSTGSFFVEFTQDGKVVATGSVPPGMALSNLVPTGTIEVFANGEHYGEGFTATPDVPDEDPTPGGGFS